MYSVRLSGMRHGWMLNSGPCKLCMTCHIMSNYGWHIGATDKDINGRLSDYTANVHVQLTVQILGVAHSNVQISLFKIFHNTCSLCVKCQNKIVVTHQISQPPNWTPKDKHNNCLLFMPSVTTVSCHCIAIFYFICLDDENLDQLKTHIETLQ